MYKQDVSSYIATAKRSLRSSLQLQHNYLYSDNVQYDLQV